MKKLIGFALLSSSLFIYSFSFKNASPSTSELNTFTVSGKIVNTKNEPLENVVVYLDEPENKLLEFPRTTKTDENGNYSFTNNPLGFTYELTASKDGNHVQGVSTLDFVLIMRHMLGIEAHLDSPFKIIAADMNADNKLSQIDLIQHRKLSLAVINELPQNEFARFINADYEFSDPNNPWPTEDEDPYSIVFKPTQDVSYGFIGIKIGDVTDNAF